MSSACALIRVHMCDVEFRKSSAILHMCQETGCLFWRILKDLVVYKLPADCDSKGEKRDRDLEDQREEERDQRERDP